MLLVDDYDQLPLTKGSLDLSDSWCHDIGSSHYMRHRAHVYCDARHPFQCSRVRQHWDKMSLCPKGNRLPVDEDYLRALHHLGFNARFPGQMLKAWNLVQFFDQWFGVAILQDRSDWQVDSVSCTTIFKSVQPPGSSLPPS